MTSKEERALVIEVKNIVTWAESLRDCRRQVPVKNGRIKSGLTWNDRLCNHLIARIEGLGNYMAALELSSYPEFKPVSELSNTVAAAYELVNDYCLSDKTRKLFLYRFFRQKFIAVSFQILTFVMDFKWPLVENVIIPADEVEEFPKLPPRLPNQTLLRWKLENAMQHTDQLPHLDLRSILLGKTSLIKRFSRDLFDPTEPPSSFNTCEAVSIFTVAKAQIWDTGINKANSATELKMLELQVNSSGGLILVYNMCEDASFQKLAQFLPLLDRARPDAFRALVATNLDREVQREVSPGRGYALAQALRCTYYELSSLSGEGVSRSLCSFFYTILLHQLEQFRSDVSENLKGTVYQGALWTASERRTSHAELRGEAFRCGKDHVRLPEIKSLHLMTPSQRARAKIPTPFAFSILTAKVTFIFGHESEEKIKTWLNLLAAQIDNLRLTQLKTS